VRDKVTGDIRSVFKAPNRHGKCAPRLVDRM